MALNYPGGYVTKSPPEPTANAAPGIWTMDQALQYIKAGTWPTPLIPDPYFNYTTLLLHGDGTNGAQNNTFLDSSTNAFSITRNGNTTQGTFSPFSQTGWSNFFDGTGDFLTAPSNSAFDFGTGELTIEFWVYANTLSNSPAVIAKCVAQGANVGWFVEIGLNTVYFGYGTSGDNFATFTVSLSANAWHHVACTRSGGTLNCFVNGISPGSQTGFSTSAIDNTNVMQIGRGFGNASFDLNGYVSNVRIVKGRVVYTSAFTPPTSPLGATSGGSNPPTGTQTSLLTCQSNRFVDNSTNAFAITRNGDVSVQAFSPFAPTAAYSAATNGGSGYFDGTGDYLQTPSTSEFNFGTGDFTIEFWIYPTAAQVAYAGVATSTVESDPSWYIQYDVNGTKLRLTTYSINILISATSVPVNTWTHIAIVRNGSGTNNCKMYFNGVQDVQATFTTTLGQTAAVKIGAGSAGVGSPVIQGYLSGFRIINGTAQYTSGFTPPTAPPTAVTNTKLLLNYTNAGIIDSTAKNDLETVGNAQIDTGTKKFGTGSMEFDGNGDYLALPANQFWNFNGSDWTIEMWLYPSNVSGTKILLENTTTGTGGLSIQMNNASLAIYTNSSTDFGGTLVANTWQHIALVRSGSTIKYYLNGTETGSATQNPGTGATGLWIGERSGGGVAAYNGFIDDLRITKGVARYTANFTAPTKAFADQ